MIDLNLLRQQASRAAKVKVFKGKIYTLKNKEITNKVFL
jgi:hypothetical protein